MQKRKIILIIGIILALSSVFMIKVYLDQQKQSLEEQAKIKYKSQQENQAPVLVAKQEIAKGTVIEPDLLAVSLIPNQYVQPQAVTSLDRIAGMVTVTPISKGEQITLNKLMSTQEAKGGSLAMMTPVGKRAITIPVDNISSIGGMIRPGDYVDVIAMVPVPVQTQEGKQATQVVTLPLFQNVLVLAVGQETGIAAREASRYKTEEKREMSPIITLALNPQEANMMAFIQEQGRIRLILRSPADSQIESVQPASWDSLFRYVMPIETAKPEVQEESKPVTSEEYVEILRGLSKEKILISK